VHSGTRPSAAEYSKGKGHGLKIKALIQLQSDGGGGISVIVFCVRRSATILSALVLFHTSFGSAQHPAPALPPVKSPSISAEQLERLQNDWADLAKYREADAQMPAPAAQEKRVVFMGDSITEGWGHDFGNSFPGKPYINRGISGQTSPQMLVRFHQDVLDLKPKVVVILAGTNDVAENTGKTTPSAIMENIDSMSELARDNGIRVVLCSVLPAKDFGWHHGLDPAPKIKSLNDRMRDYAERKGFVYVDYYSHLVDSEGGMKAEFSPDGVHPNAAGYAIMAPLVEAGITEALSR
jgi:acyl-CoA thioesterase-1